MLFAGATLAATGRLPDWGEYLAYLDAFLFGSLGDLTYDVARWTPALAVGAGYAASAAALAELARRRGAIVARERPALIAIAGMTAYGIVLLSYYVDRSQDHILIYVALPARAGRRALARPAAALRRRGVARDAHAAGSPSASRSRCSSSPSPGRPSATASRARRWRTPPRAAARSAGRSSGSGIRRRSRPRHRPASARSRATCRASAASLLMVSPDLGIEILLRSGRADRLVLGDPWEASFVAEEELPDARAAVDALRPGDRMLHGRAGPRAARQAARAAVARPAQAARRAAGAAAALGARSGSTQRFRLRPVAPPEGGFTVVELARRG